MKEWKVTFSPDSQERGKEIPLDLYFLWGGRQWKLPSLYLFEKGVVLDFLLEAEQAELNTFIKKWDLLREVEHTYSELQREQIEQEHPLWMDFTPTLRLNSQALKYKGCTGRCWLPAACLGGTAMDDRSMQAVMEHYELDENKGWGFRRCRFLFAEEKCTDIQSMELSLSHAPRTVLGEILRSPEKGTALDFCHPISGQMHHLTVHEISAEALPEGYFQQLCYSVEPRTALTLRDIQPSDCGFAPILMLPKETGRSIAPSSLRKKPVTATDWQMVFPVKTAEDISLQRTIRKEDDHETL